MLSPILDKKISGCTGANPVIPLMLPPVVYSILGKKINLSTTIMYYNTYKTGFGIILLYGVPNILDLFFWFYVFFNTEYDGTNENWHWSL
jgi:hypothetical protein